MGAFQSLSDSEMEIMQIIWDSEGPMTSARLMELFAHRNWKAQTVSTFLTRLVAKGVLRMERQGRGNLYFPALTPEEYRQQEAKYVIDSMYHGDLLDFLSAFYGGERVSKDDLDTLKQWFEKEASRD